MRYIKTSKGKIIDLVKLGCIQTVIDDPGSSKDLKIYLDTHDCGEIIAQADTIEELCDYVFLFDEELTIRKITHEDDGSLIEWLKECTKLGMKIKLAILTDKGLIYVAKMKGISPNGEIDWELL